MKGFFPTWQLTIPISRPKLSEVGMSFISIGKVCWQNHQQHHARTEHIRHLCRKTVVLSCHINLKTLVLKKN